MLCVDALKRISCRPKFISLESTKTSWSDLLNEFDTLETLGYTKFKVVRQGRHKSGHSRRKTAEKFAMRLTRGDRAFRRRPRRSVARPEASDTQICADISPIQDHRR